MSRGACTRLHIEHARRESVGTHRGLYTASVWRCLVERAAASNVHMSVKTARSAWSGVVAQRSPSAPLRLTPVGPQLPRLCGRSLAKCVASCRFGVRRKQCSCTLRGSAGRPAASSPRVHEARDTCMSCVHAPRYAWGPCAPTPQDLLETRHTSYTLGAPVRCPRGPQAARSRVQVASGRQPASVPSGEGLRASKRSPAESPPSCATAAAAPWL